MGRFGSLAQLRLFDEDPSALGVEGTFRPNHEALVHRWYPYLEGFSHAFVTSLIEEFAPSEGPITLYEPFAGSGTTPTVAAFGGHRCLYSEINPFMRLVIETKTNAVRLAFPERDALHGYFGRLCAYAVANPISTGEARTTLDHAFAGRPYFTETRLAEILAVQSAIGAVDAPNPAFIDFARLALGAIAVGSSELRRAGDLRYRTAKERLRSDHSPIAAFAQQCEMIARDLQQLEPPQGEVTMLQPSALDPVQEGSFADFVITSPPYLNGTNYIRNAKLELWLTGFMRSEKELTGFRKEALTAGICDVVRNGREVEKFDFVESVACELDEVTYDRRIPQMVRRYFSDTRMWLENVQKALKPGGQAVIDIGDSRFANVHVPTDKCMASVAELVGLSVHEERFVRGRKSKDGSPLKQVLLILRKSEDSAIAPAKAEVPYAHRAREFAAKLPHKDEPYASRNWGHALHSLCSYQGKLKPAIAHILVREFTSHGDRVLDPLAGAGTIPLEACLQGRQAIANDIQELAFLLSSSKVTVGDPQSVWREYDHLCGVVERGIPDETDLTFGFNGSIAEFFDPGTLDEILKVRRFLRNSLMEGLSWERAFVLACFAHLLHGNRPYALSRNSHPVTPFKPTGEFEYRPSLPRLRKKIQRALESEPPRAATIAGEAHFGDYKALRLDAPVDAIITSPPFHNSTRFYIANWMRLWFCGWEREDFDLRKATFLETQQKKSMEVYRTFLDKCAEWLRPGGRLIMHLGRVKGFDMCAEIQQRMDPRFRLIHAFDECVAGREKFGLSDQGATDAHQYLFLERR